MNPFSKISIAAVIATALSTPVAANCLNFFQHATPGPYHGGTYSLDANTTIIVRPTMFWGPPAAPTPNFGMIEMEKSACFGGPASLQINNASLSIQIMQRDPNAKVVNFNYCDLGGFENVGANGSAPPQYIGEITNVPPMLNDPFGGQVRVMASEGQIPGGKEGKLIFEATEHPIVYMEVGGQEFFGHSSCVN